MRISDWSSDVCSSDLLFKSAIEKMSGGSMDLRVSDLTSDSGRDRIKSGLGDIAQRVHTSSNELYARLEEWGAMLGQLGVPGMPRECRLRRMHSRSTALPDGLHRWPDLDTPEAAALPHPCDPELARWGKRVL